MSVNRPTPRLTLAAAFALATLWGANASAGELVVSAAASLTNAFRTWPPPMKRACRHQGGPELRRLRRAAAADRQGRAGRRVRLGRPEGHGQGGRGKAVKPASRVDFAANQVVLIVPTDSRANITALKDLTRDDVKRIAYGNPASVPVGRYTQGALQAAGLWDAVQARACWRRACARAWTMCRAARSTPASCSPPTPPSWRTRSRSPCACRRRRPSPIPSP